jgi:mannose-6-phosphate isomerase-like protein (cupin superfamily)
MSLHLQQSFDKEKVFTLVETFLKNQRFTITNRDKSRPWGGFYVIDEKDSHKFITTYFQGVPEANSSAYNKISPKILIVEAGKRLSWQYHHRRAEVWKVISGEAGIIVSDTDKEGNLEIKKKGEIIILQQGQRHRLVGLNSWAVIAEIWQHTDLTNLSNEEDIVRVADDFGR